MEDLFSESAQILVVAADVQLLVVAVIVQIRVFKVHVCLALSFIILTTGSSLHGVGTVSLFVSHVVVACLAEVRWCCRPNPLNTVESVCSAFVVKLPIFDPDRIYKHLAGCVLRRFDRCSFSLALLLLLIGSCAGLIAQPLVAHVHDDPLFQHGQPTSRFFVDIAMMISGTGASCLVTDRIGRLWWRLLILMCMQKMRITTPHGILPGHTRSCRLLQSYVACICPFPFRPCTSRQRLPHLDGGLWNP